MVRYLKHDRTILKAYIEKYSLLSFIGELSEIFYELAEESEGGGALSDYYAFAELLEQAVDQLHTSDIMKRH